MPQKPYYYQEKEDQRQQEYREDVEDPLITGDGLTQLLPIEENTPAVVYFIAHAFQQVKSAGVEIEQGHRLRM